jgi:hypothetical protein
LTTAASVFFIYEGRDGKIMNGIWGSVMYGKKALGAVVEMRKVQFLVAVVCCIYAKGEGQAKAAKTERGGLLAISISATPAGAK